MVGMERSVSLSDGCGSGRTERLYIGRKCRRDMACYFVGTVYRTLRGMSDASLLPGI